MKWIVIIGGVVALGFVALMLLASNQTEPPEDYEAPGILGWLNVGWGTPRLLDEPMRLPDEGWTVLVPRSCGTPARVATLELLSGTFLHVSYECRTDAEPSCTGPRELCTDQHFCLLSAEGVSGCPDSREVVGEADLSFGPEGGTLRLTPSLPAGATAELR